MNQLWKLAFMISLGLSNATAVLADDAHHASASAQAAAAETAMTDGEVKKINKEAGKMTIKHGPIVNLDMPKPT